MAIGLLLTLSSNPAIASASTVAGVDFTEFPADKQLFPRNIYTNKGTVDIAGVAYSYSTYDQIRLKIYRDDQLFDTQIYNLNYSGNQANFQFSVDINAELKEYEIEVYGADNGSETLEAIAKGLVAGDVYVINGQSNAQANASQHPDDYDLFSRSYTDNFGWGVINLSYPGQWGGRIAKEIIQTHGIPVAIFNQAVGAQAVSFYLKNYSNPYNGNYGELLTRLELAEVKDDIRGILWFQGETDGWATSTEQYKETFTELYNAWKQDYNPSHFYLFQIRRLSCSHPEPFVLEAHRQLAEEIYDLEIMSTHNADHDGCHFEYYGGYQLLGNRMYALMAKDLYEGTSNNVRSPNIVEANISGNSIVIETEYTNQLNVTGSPWSDFELEGGDAVITGGYVSGKYIHVQTSGSTTGLTGISYLGHPGNANDWITNQNGVGVLAWYDFPIGNSTGPGPQDCDAIGLTTSGNTITITNLQDAAPNSQAQIFDSSWNQLFNCSSNCNDTENIPLANGEYKVLIKLYDDNWNSICVIDETVIVENAVIDNDNDGVPQDDDCDDNDPSIPTNPGTACNDYNPNTTNDVIQSDGCTCEGEMINNDQPDCDDVVITATNTGLTFSNLSEGPVTTVQVFNNNWSNQFSCSNNCSDTEIVALTPGSYFVYVKLYDEDWNLICQIDETFEIGGGWIDNDNDGVPAGDDCDDNDPTIPTVPGNPCNDDDITTNNDVIQSDGCTCAGTPTNYDIDCNNVAFSSTNGGITITGLGSAPISRVLIFNDDWATVFSCNNNCNPTETVSLAEGTYRIYIKFYNDNWVEQCARNEEIVVGGGGPPSSSGIDLELSIEADVDEYIQYENMTYTLTLENNGSESASNITVNFPLPDETSYTSYSSSSGDYIAWDGDWEVGNLGAGQTAVLQLVAFTLTHEVSIYAFAQVIEMDGEDVDSNPDNNNSSIPVEDDEAGISLEAEDRSGEAVDVLLAQNRLLTIQKLFPLPASDEINLQISSNAAADLKFSVFNNLGVLQQTHSIQVDEGFNSIELNIEELPSGMYYILFETPNRHDPVLFLKQRI